MYGQPPPFRPGGGAGRGITQTPQQQQVPLNPNFFPNPNLFLLQQNPNFLSHLNPFFQNPQSFPQIPQQFPNSNFPIQLNSDNNNFQTQLPYGQNNSTFPQQHVKVQNEMVEKLDKAAVRARSDLLESKENVSARKVSQAALLNVKAESWESLGIQMQQVPSLNSLLVTEGKINAFIHCFVAVRRITSLYDLEVAICESEGVKRFEELELGPLLRHPLAVHYFSLTSNVKEVHRIRTEEIISYLCEFIYAHKKKEIKVDTFLDFISKKQSVSRSHRETLCVRVQDFGLYVNLIKQARLSEDSVLVKCHEKIRMTSVRRSKKRPLFSAQKRKMDDHFNAISQRMKSFSSENTQFCGKHIRFMSSSSEDDDSEASEYEDIQDEKNTDSSCSLSLPNGRSERVSSCPYPSATEEMRRLGLKSEVESTSCTPGGGVRCNEDIELSRRKRRYENMSSSTSLPRKLPKKDKFDADLKHKGNGDHGISCHSLPIESLEMFVTTWKEACRDNSADEVLERMLQFYNTRRKRKVKEMFTSYPFVGLLYTAVTCIKFGIWDNMYDAFHTFSQQGMDDKPIESSADYISIDVESAKKDVAVPAPEILTHKDDVLIAGLQSFVNNVPAAILAECKQIEQRLMLHEVGLSLGLLEWVNDYQSFRSSATTSPGSSCLDVVNSELNASSMIGQGELDMNPASSGEMLVSCEVDHHDKDKPVSAGADSANVSVYCPAAYSEQLSILDNHIDNDPARFIESIRQEEFGLDQSLSATENSMLERQHARLGRALHCLSQELYSQDSHFILELVQNADDNIYTKNVEPTLTFILQEKGIVVLNNEQGFSFNNIRALCDVGNSTKKNLDAGYIGKKGIGFKSVFRVTDAPEIHSNGFHIKFDITEGQIGFVLPTIIPPCDIDLYTRLASADADRLDQNSWNTCIVLPFRSNLLEGFAMNNILSMFSDVHPSLLLFLHRLQCIKFRNLLDDSLIVMRKEVIGDGIVEVALGNQRMTWFIESKKLKADIIRSDVQTTEISIAFTLKETGEEGYVPILNQQPVFSFLPLRTYGFKFILQGDFVLPSSREEVDGNSPWNQWLLSEFPDLFVSAERSFCALPCYKSSPGKAITLFMSFVPIVGEVHGFFSSLPRRIISKLRMSNCLILEGDEKEWVPPFKVLRNWTDQTRSLLPDSLLHKHLGLGFLNKDIVLSDSLAKALGVEDYGPIILLRVISSLCRSDDGLKSMGLDWLASWLSTIYVMSSQLFMQTSPSFGTESDFILNLQKIPFIPLSDGKYSSVDEDTIWLHSEAVGQGINDECLIKAFPKLYAKMRIVSPSLLAAAASIESSCSDITIMENAARMLYKVGVQRLSIHDIVKLQILPALSDDKNAAGQEELMIEYLAFAMFHLQSSCTTCSLERDGIIAELHEKALILTNFGFKRSNEAPIHFNQEYGNPVDVDRLVSGLDMKWHEIHTAYVRHPITKSISGGVLKWRNFFHEIGVTDFVQVVQVNKCVPEMSLVNSKDVVRVKDMMSKDSVAKNWESKELFHLLSWLSSRGDGEKSKYLLEILDGLWDDYFSDKVIGYCIDATGECKPFKSSLLSILQDFPWIASNINDKLHYPKDLFHDCVAVNSIFGGSAPYTIPKVRSEKFLADIGLKTQVTLDDALSILSLWRKPESHFKASVSQMSSFYAFLWKGMAHSKKKVMEELHSGPFIFVPYTSVYSDEDALPGALLSPQEVYWHDSIGPVDQIKSIHPKCVSSIAISPQRKMLYNFYPSLHDFFVNECGVDESPPFTSYLQILLQLSAIALPHQAAKRVFEVFLIWDDALKSGSMSFEDIEYLKRSLLEKEYTVLPTRQDKWVSLHSSFGPICWCDDDNLGREFRNLEGVDFLCFGESTDEDSQMLPAKVSIIMQRLGIPALSEIVTREAISYGPADSSFIFSLVNWVLPYAQRYIYNAHSDKYFQLKQSCFENLRHLKIVVVEKLFYRNKIKKCEITSKKRHQCNCLLQENILYCSRESDPHSIFLELSCLLFDGAPQLHFANFLHMITTMAESGATEEQTEFFILNSQKVPKLPAEESCWSLQSVSSSMENNATLLENCHSLKVEELNSSLFKWKPSINSNWPPVDWKTAPGFNSVCLKTPGSSSLQIIEGNYAEKNLERTDICPNDISSEFNNEVDSTAISQGAVLVEAEISESQSNLSSNLLASSMNIVLDSVDLVSPDSKNFRPSDCSERDQVSAQQALLTGRLGELVAFKYFVGKIGERFVKWVNETNETGLPYDIVLGGDENSREYIEVKATKFGRKNWFLISMREWQFAVEKGESFSIAHVVLADENMAKVTIYKNPARLCQLGNLKLAIEVPRQ